MINATRRDALLSTALATALLSYTARAEAEPANSISGAAKDGVSRSATRVRGFADPEMDFQLLRGLGVANTMGASVGEVLAAARNIKDGDPRTWPPAFVAIGEQTAALGRSALEKQHQLSARDHFQRASMYYRAAEYYDDPVTETARAHGIRSRDLFLEAVTLMRWKTEVLQIPFERAWLPGYFMQPATVAAQPRKTLIVLTGFDGTAEELYFQTGAAALERGWNVLLAEGPGQTGFLRFHPHVGFRPDYEAPVEAMIDYVLSRDDVDAQRLALYGISYGGYFASRAAAHDERIKALVANSPIPDLRSYVIGFTGADTAANPPPITLEQIDSIPDQQLPPGMKLSLKMSLRRFGADSIAAWLQRLRDFQIGDALRKIRCPSLALVGEGEGAVAMELFESFIRGVGGPVTQRIFTQAEGADSHCQLANLPLSNAVIYDWLDEVFA
jgi:pimeloyl-ACP methyl ester carboxylesterase